VTFVDVLGAVQAAAGAPGQHRADPADAFPDIEIFRSEQAEPRQVDLLIAKTPFEEDVLRRAPFIEVGTLQAPVASAEDLIVYKLLADRPRGRDRRAQDSGASRETARLAPHRALGPLLADRGSTAPSARPVRGLNPRRRECLPSPAAP
jgi:hypothetical protein